MTALIRGTQSGEMFSCSTGSFSPSTKRRAPREEHRETSTERRAPRDEHRHRFVTMTMKSCFLLLLLCGAVCGLGSVVVKEYIYKHDYYNWHEAQSFCRSLPHDSTDLATIFKPFNELHLEFYHAWVGMYRTGNYWVWTDGSTIDHHHWEYWWLDQSNGCVAISYSSSSKWFYSTDCEEHAFFFCEEGGDRFSFLPQSKTWAEARQYCQSQSAHLASLTRSDEVNSAVVEQDFPVWTGLHREGGTWKWSSGLPEYRNWASQEPSVRGDCVSISSRDKTMSTQNCSDRFPVVCFRTNLVLVKENKTWEEALEHCRALASPSQNGLRYELVSVQSGPDHEDLTTKVKEADTEEVWAGLRFLAGDWLWVNGAPMSFPDLPLCPPVLQHCGALTKNDTDGLLLADCSEKRNFLCYSTY